MKKTASRIIGVMLAAALTAATIPTTGVNSYVSWLVKTTEAAASISITKAEGGLETAWAEWTADTTGVSGFAVSYAKGSGSYTKIDDNLIRQYTDGHWRADIPGLAAGDYKIKIEALNSSTVVASAASSTVSVKAHDRRGFA
ncbi:MAG: pectate lyase, partial [Firmicutes bacterium]|nr:pectate lyase [Bacillota bacterium]